MAPRGAVPVAHARESIEENKADAASGGPSLIGSHWRPTEELRIHYGHQSRNSNSASMLGFLAG